MKPKPLYAMGITHYPVPTKLEFPEKCKTPCSIPVCADPTKCGKGWMYKTDDEGRKCSL